MSATHAALNLLVPHELRSLIRAEAKSRKMTQRDFVQLAIREFLRRELLKLESAMNDERVVKRALANFELRQKAIGKKRGAR